MGTVGDAFSSASEVTPFVRKTTLNKPPNWRFVSDVNVTKLRVNTSSFSWHGFHLMGHPADSGDLEFEP